MLLFVYGTLLKGLERNSVLANSEFKGSATIQATLFDCGQYPGIREGDHLVHGEVYKISAATLQLLDQIEGFQENNSGASLFIRRELYVKLVSGTEITAFCYFYNHGIADKILIEHGDYRRYRTEKTGISRSE